MTKRFQPGDEVTYSGVGNVWFTVEEIVEKPVAGYIVIFEEEDFVFHVKAQGTEIELDWGDDNHNRRVYDVTIRGRLKG